jgi:hypothetical protein
MPRYIFKLKDRYLEYSTVVDAPVTSGMTLDEFREHYREEYGRKGMQGLEQRLQRVEEKGISAVLYKSVEDLLANNHAGPKECKLTVDEIYRAYCLFEEVRGWKVEWIE